MKTLEQRTWTLTPDRDLTQRLGRIGKVPQRVAQPVEDKLAVTPVSGKFDVGRLTDSEAQDVLALKPKDWNDAMALQRIETNILGDASAKYQKLLDRYGDLPSGFRKLDDKGIVKEITIKEQWDDIEAQSMAIFKGGLGRSGGWSIGQDSAAANMSATQAAYGESVGGGMSLSSSPVGFASPYMALGQVKDALIVRVSNLYLDDARKVWANSLDTNELKDWDRTLKRMWYWQVKPSLNEITDVATKMKVQKQLEDIEADDKSILETEKKMKDMYLEPSYTLPGEHAKRYDYSQTT